MNHEALCQRVSDFLGGPEALRAHVTAQRQDATTQPPASPSGAVLMDYRPEGGIVIGGYEDGHWWNLDNGDRFRHRPYAWAPLPEGFTEA